MAARTPALSGCQRRPNIPRVLQSCPEHTRPHKCCPAAKASRAMPHRRRPTKCWSLVGSAVQDAWQDGDYIEVGTLSRPHGLKGEVVVSIDTSFPEERFGKPGARYIQPPQAQGIFVNRPVEAPKKVELVSGRPHKTRGNDVWLVRFKEVLDRDAAERLRNCKLLIHKQDRVELDHDDEFYSNDLVGMTVALNPYHPTAGASVGDQAASLVTDDSTRAASPEDELTPESHSSLAPATGEDEEGGEGLELWEIGKVTDVYDGTGTHGVLRIDFSAGLFVDDAGFLQRVGATGGAAPSEDESNGMDAETQDNTGAEKFSRALGTKDSGLLPFARDIVPEIDVDERLMIVDPPLGWLDMYLTPKKEKKRKRFRKRKSPRTPPVQISESPAAA